MASHNNDNVNNLMLDDSDLSLLCDLQHDYDDYTTTTTGSTTTPTLDNYDNYNSYNCYQQQQQQQSYDSASATGRIFPNTAHDVDVTLQQASVTSSFGAMTSPTGQQSEDVGALSLEEKRLLARDLGLEHTILAADDQHNHVTLTRHEQRLLRTVRRKIRNKESARVSRDKRRQYLLGLEQRVEQCTRHNMHLQTTVAQLQQQNNCLMAYLSKLQSVLQSSQSTIAPAGPRHAAAACFMILMVSFGLVLPMFSSLYGRQSSLPGGPMMTSPPRRLSRNDAVLFRALPPNDVTPPTNDVTAVDDVVIRSAGNNVTPADASTVTSHGSGHSVGFSNSSQCIASRTEE